MPGDEKSKEKVGVGPLVQQGEAKKESGEKKDSSMLDMAMKLLMALFSLLTGKKFASDDSSKQDINAQSIKSFLQDPDTKKSVSEFFSNPLVKQMAKGLLSLPGVEAMAGHYLKQPGVADAIKSTLNEVPGLKSLVGDMVKGTPIEKAVQGVIGDVGSSMLGAAKRGLSTLADSPTTGKSPNSGPRQ